MAAYFYQEGSAVKVQNVPEYLEIVYKESHSIIVSSDCESGRRSDMESYSELAALRRVKSSSSL